MTALASERWRSRWPTQDAARRYLGTIQDQGRRQERADFLGVPLLVRPVLSQIVENPASTQALHLLELGSASGALYLTLPYPPSLNSIWRNIVMTVKGKPQVRVLLSEKGREYRRSVMHQVEQAGNPATPAGSRLALHLRFCPPDRRARNLSNITKALEDALTHAGV